ncbi:MAG: DNA polymerase-3 subunit delta' [Sphingobacteriales bacterium]|jgi:DNA polymerase-3 subunit delta'
MRFADIPGLSEAKSKLAHAVNSGRLAHAILLHTPTGGGGLALSWALAQYVSCDSPIDNDSCGKCITCKQISSLNYIDLSLSFPIISSKDYPNCNALSQQFREALKANPYLNLNSWLEKLDALNKQANIPIAECHNILQTLAYKAQQGKHKFLILWLPEFLGKEGNSLLKFIEEPPQYTHIIFVTEKPFKILNTILSRTQQFKINGFKKDDLLTYFPEETTEKITEVFKATKGDLGKAIELINHTSSESFGTILIEWLSAISSNDGINAIGQATKLAALSKENQKAVFSYCSVLLEESLYNSAIESEEKSIFTNWPNKAVQQFQAMIDKAMIAIQLNINSKILFNNMTIQLIKLMQSSKIKITA